MKGIFRSIIYKKSPNFNNNNWFLYDSSNTSGVYIDYAEAFNEGSGPSRPPDNCFYYAKAQDNSYQVSINSDTIGYPSLVCPGCTWEEGDNISSNNNSDIELPKDYSITNFPNPFNPSTKIYYTIPREGNVKITVYNSLGQTVTELVNEFKQPGVYIAEFNGSNLSSGVYFYRIESDNFIQTSECCF